jgi:hypothetical protein
MDAETLAKPWSHSSQRRKWARAQDWDYRWLSVWRTGPAVPRASKALRPVEQPPNCGFQSP